MAMWDDISRDDTIRSSSATHLDAERATPRKDPRSTTPNVGDAGSPSAENPNLATR